MTTTDATAPDAPANEMPASGAKDRRGSPIPTFGMVATRFKELRKRRGLMIALVLVTIGIPTIFLAIRLIAHAVAPHTYGPAGGYDIFTGMTSGVLYVFGFIVAAMLGCTAGSVDLTEGMFRHLVVTGRSRLALYLARIPAGLAIILTVVGIGFIIVCAVCVFAAPQTLNFNGVNVPAGLSKPQLETWGAGHADEVICNFELQITQSTPDASLIMLVTNDYPCGGPSNGPVPGSKTNGPGPVNSGPQPTQAQIKTVAGEIAGMNYAAYTRQFLYPSISLMIRAGLWLELEAAIGFIVGLGLGSLIGQRTVGVVLMIVLEVILTPLFSRAHLPHLINLQRAVVGVATAHLAPGGIPVFGGGGGGPAGGSGNPQLIPESTTVAIIVIVAWLVVWSVLGAWRMMTRDA
jgi:hypothetical protein